MERLSNLLIEDAISRWKLQDYDYIMKNYKKTKLSDTSKSKEFRSKYTSFYVMGTTTSNNYKDFYFARFELLKNKGDVSLEEIFSELNQYGSNTCYFSFATKMLATIRPEKPIFDKWVRFALSLPEVGSYGTLEEKTKRALHIYNDLENWYDKNMINLYVLDWIKCFDEHLPKYRHISNVKKVDYFLWTMGRNNHKVSEFM